MLEELARPASRTADRDRTTEKILAAALEEFLQVGIRRARMEEIARRAGVSRVTVHRRFASKQELVTAVLIAEARALYARCQAEAATHHHLEDKIAACFALVIDAARRGALAPLLTNDPAPFLPSFTVDGEPLIALMRAFYLNLLREADVIYPTMEQATDVLARAVVSYCLTPTTPTTPLTDPTTTAAFARRHLAPIILPPSP
ncbi:TetR/AcrR family transcriptional regulator [Actinocorallia sp. API 0066]|uniref:TetR/AcrR family transcriptional regulator n=1 Tax=Actinocorallia sp. API 0066 TaxID=2896846 RepID=UPI001E3FCDA8|nr:TetR/AcrR family transcriptional regulator [Actinocorallia sp. API 0066]MCD0451018.1 TetR/AcrR family transcriptional regulator [Actinocorallia sp. API 0066]